MVAPTLVVGGRSLAGQDRDGALSAREGEVARRYVDGLSYKEIARDLEISPSTVRTHLNTIYRKLEVTSRIELLHRLNGDGPNPATEPVVERRQLTVMFVDLVASTTLATALDAEDMHELLQAYRREVRRVVEAAGGHAAGFPGDGVVVCFGWPEALEDAAERAVRAGLEVLVAIGRISAPDGRPLAARVGIATGVVVVDGSKGDADSLTGGTPNLAARLQSAAEPGGLVIAAGTRELVGDLFVIEDLGPREIKGLPAPVPVYRVTGERPTVSRFEARRAYGITPMVGRDSELALLVERWNRVLDGEGQAVLLTGEPGIGKSRIAAALIERAMTADGTAPVLLRYQTSPQQGDSPLWPVGRQLAAAAGLDEAATDTERLARLESHLRRGVDEPGEALPLLAGLLQIPGVDELPAMSASRRRERLLEVLVDQLVGLARRSPVLVLYEDLHWIDPTSLALLERIIGQIDDLPVLLLMTSRPDGEPHLASHAHLTRMTLNRLNRNAAAAIVARRAGAAALQPEVVTAILARGDGVPLYIEEMTAAIIETGAAADTVPTTLQDSLMARLDRLGDAKEVAQIAAVIGREFELELLQAVAGAGAALRDAVDRLVAAELVFRRGPRLSFKHALVQDVAYQSLLRGRRAELHGRIAEALLGRFPTRIADEPQTVAHHLEHAGRRAAAIDYYGRAAELANNKGANKEARRYMERALGLIEGLPEGAERVRREIQALTRIGRIGVALEGHGSAAAAEAFGRGLALCREAGLDAAELPLLVGLIVQLSTSGATTKALALAPRLMDLVQRNDDPVFRVEAGYALGITYAWRGELTAADRHFQTIRQHYAPDQHERHLAIYGQDPGVVGLCRGGMNRWYMGLVDQAARDMEAAVELARRLGHPFSINYALTWRAMHALETEAAAVARRAVDANLDYAAEQAFMTWLSMGQSSRARWTLAHGRPDEAVAECERAVAMLRTVGGGQVPLALALHGAALCRFGEPVLGLARLDEALRLNDAITARWAEVEILRLRARCGLAAGTGDAEAVLRRAVATARRQGALMLELQATADLARLLDTAAGRRQGHDLLAGCLARFTEGHGTRPLLEARRLLERLAG
jgi:class 3 adenylate cyclase/tetratricopeptide (TPR) repeat protein